MSSPGEPREEDLSEEELVELIMSKRADSFPETHIFIRTMPRVYWTNTPVVGYVHQYEGQGTGEQVLSLAMRELIATCVLCSKGDDRFAPKHVRRMWRIGVTNRVILEAATAMIPATGFSTVPHVSLALVTAADPKYTDGAIPEGGAPKTVTPFAELSQGRVKVKSFDDASISTDPDWTDIAAIDPEYARRAARLVDLALLVGGPSDKDLLGPGPRELICIAGLCGRGFVDMTARHIRRAYAYGMTRRQVFEAISCITPMMGAPAIQIGMRAIRQADSL